MKKYLLFTCATFFLLACNSKVVDPTENEDTRVDLVQVDVSFPSPGNHGLSIEFNEKSFFYVRYYNLYTLAPVEWNNHFVTYLPRGDNKVSLSKFNFKDNPDSSITHTQDFILGNAEKYNLLFLFDGEFEVMVNDI